MSGVYGSWLKGEEDVDLQKKFQSRLTAFTKIAQLTVSELQRDHKNLDGCIHISHQNLRIAIGRYYNDVFSFEANHKIKLIHPSKIIAHTIKWLAVNPVLFTSATPEKFKSLGDSKKGLIEKAIILNINFVFIFEIVEYFMAKVNPYITEKTYDNIYKNLVYYLKTANYNERMASLWFEQLLRR